MAKYNLSAGPAAADPNLIGNSVLWPVELLVFLVPLGFNLNCWRRFCMMQDDSPEPEFTEPGPKPRAPSRPWSAQEDALLRAAVAKCRSYGICL